MGAGRHPHWHLAQREIRPTAMPQAPLLRPIGRTAQIHGSSWLLLWLLRPSSFTCHWPRALTLLHSSSSLSYDRPLKPVLQRCDFDRVRRVRRPQSGLLSFCLAGLLACLLDWFDWLINQRSLKIIHPPWPLPCYGSDLGSALFLVFPIRHGYGIRQTHWWCSAQIGMFWPDYWHLFLIMG